MTGLGELQLKLLSAKPGRLIPLTKKEYRLLMDNARDPLLQEREKTHGSFETNALISQQLKEIIHGTGLRTKITTATGFTEMKLVHREALDMIALKLSRILSGQANFKDHWRDISGYALLGMEACDETRQK
ncbi:MAG: hypothetical protein KGL39_43590 [Patescibacteria group bacterium]|nr:hypothetical protein [Patescibacteria group bacterium]